MATRTRPKTPLYDEDFYLWTLEQAALLRARRCDALPETCPSSLDQIRGDGWP